MDVSNYFELCSNYVAGNVFVLKRCSSVSQDWPCFAGRTSQRSGKANEKLHAIKKNLVCSVPGQGLSPGHLRSHDGICWTLLNKRELVKSDVEVARLKARLGQTDGLLGALLVANPFAAWAHDFQIRNEKDPQSFRNVLLLHFPNIFQTRTAQRATYFVLPHSVAA